MICTALLAMTLAQAPPGLSATDLAQLRKLKHVIYLPSWIPRGFRGKVSVNMDKDPIQCFYSVVYSKGKSSFTLQTASEGIGDIFLEDGNGELPASIVKVKNPVFGLIEIEFDKKTKSQFVVNWMERKGTALPHYVGVLGSKMELSDAKRIVGSLRVFR